MRPQTVDYQQAYAEQSFWSKLKHHALRAGQDVVLRALELYFAARAEHTPAWAKTTIYGALGYFISTLDAIPDLTPILGFTDDLGVLAAALAAVAANVTPEVAQQAQRKLADWFEVTEALLPAVTVAGSIDYPAIRELLQATNLPVDDLSEQDVWPECLITKSEQVIVSTGALAQHGEFGLLRSLATRQDFQARGLGSKILQGLEARALSRGIKVLYLLTETAADWFQRRHYEFQDRACVPAAIAKLPQFSMICPTSASCLRKVLVSD